MPTKPTSTGRGFEILEEAPGDSESRRPRVSESGVSIDGELPYPKGLIVFADAVELSRMLVRNAAASRVAAARAGRMDEHAILREALLSEEGRARVAAGATAK